MPPSPNADDLADVFDLDPTAWSPRPAVYRVALAAAPPSARPLTSRELFAILRARGFRETRRRGVVGFVGIRVPASIAALPAFVPEHSASTYRRGDRSPEARRARHLEAAHSTLRTARTNDPGTPPTPAGRDRFTPPNARAADSDRATLAESILPLKRAARALEQMIGQTYGTELPEHHPDARRLRDLRDQISDLTADLRRA